MLKFEHKVEKRIYGFLYILVSVVFELKSCCFYFQETSKVSEEEIQAEKETTNWATGPRKDKNFDNFT